MKDTTQYRNLLDKLDAVNKHINQLENLIPFEESASDTSHEINHTPTEFVIELPIRLEK